MIRFDHNISLSTGLTGAIAVLIVGGLLAGPGWADEDWVWRVVGRSLQAAAQVPYQGYRDVVILRNGDKVAGFQQKVAQARGGRRRVVVLEPAEQRGRLEVSDGKRCWEYYPQANKVISSSAARRHELEGRRGGPPKPPHSRLQAEYLGDGTVAGHSAHIIKLSNSAGRPVRKLWVDREKFIQLKVQRFDLHGDLVYSAYFTSINYNPTFPDDLFTFAPPAGCKVIHLPGELPRMELEKAERRVGFKAKLPTYLPEGFELEHSHIATPRLKNCLVLWLPFSNGVDRFSLFQGPRTLKISSDHGSGGFCWMVGKFRFVLTGCIPSEEVQKIKASIPK